MNSNGLVLTAAACRVSGEVEKEIEVQSLNYINTPLKLQAQRRLEASIIREVKNQCYVNDVITHAIEAHS